MRPLALAAGALALVFASAGARGKPGVEKPKPKAEAAPRAADKGARTLGPGAGQGERKVSPGPREPARAVPVLPEPTKKAAAAPAEPPPAPAKVDEEARRQIAGGPTADDLRGTKDPELSKLREAERVLFPKPLHGVRPGWSWAIPSAPDGEVTVDATGLPPGPAALPPTGGVDTALDAGWLRGLTLPNLPTRVDARVVKYLKFYRDDARGRSIARTWAKKAGRLTPALRAELAKARLPTDLVWLSLIESGHNSAALSSAGAAGLWQFIPESARMYGLTVDRWVDERLDPERSTEAAVKYLTDLWTRFGNWELAMAAYNMGHGGLLRAVRKFNTNDFWSLSRYEAGLPWETTLYVPKILATAIVMANKKAFQLDDIEPEPPLAFDVVSVGAGVELAEVARAAEVTLEDVRALNGQYLSSRTPPVGRRDRWPVRVPSGRGLVAEQRLARRTPGAGREPHVALFGDTPESIARMYGVAARDVAQMNGLAPDARLEPGSVVLVPSVVPGAPSEPPPEEVVVVPARRFGDTGRRRVFYRVLAGDHPAEIASAFGAALSELAIWNGLDPGAHLQAGMTLQIFVKPEFDLSRVRHLGEHDVRVLVAGTEEFFEYFEAQNGRKRLTVVANKGDTLAVLGKRYGMSAGMMERINRIPAGTALAEGQRVVVYANGDAPSGGLAPPADPRPLASVTAPVPGALPPLPPGVVAGPANGPRTMGH